MALTFDALHDEYGKLWRTMQVRPEKVTLADRVATKILANKARYQAVEKKTNVPWFMVGAIHAMEGGLNFGTHLHNGDSLSARTWQVPAGRPASGTPPFTWEVSALDALTMSPHSLHRVAEWSIERICYELEKYNGWGYRRFHPGVKSPYLWSYSNHYSEGKYVGDGQWSSTAVSGQCGAMVLIQRLAAHDASVAAQIAMPAKVPPPPDIEPVTPKPPKKVAGKVAGGGAVIIAGGVAAQQAGFGWEAIAIAAAVLIVVGGFIIWKWRK